MSFLNTEIIYIFLQFKLHGEKIFVYARCIALDMQTQVSHILEQVLNGTCESMYH